MSGDICLEGILNKYTGSYTGKEAWEAFTERTNQTQTDQETPGLWLWYQDEAPRGQQESQHHHTSQVTQGDSMFMRMDTGVSDTLFPPFIC